jgi:hypothetical protein
MGSIESISVPNKAMVKVSHISCCWEEEEIKILTNECMYSCLTGAAG